ncbi:MAG: Glu/Leu/Phe/Val dehydrogenase [Enterobacterales bacterium]|nr:Glu/Leu/Phe/Val dehydrogenase [Enterobacterales bacterium]
MTVFKQKDYDDHETVVFCRDPHAGLTAVIAVHSTVLGPAVGGCRMWTYDDDDQALTDALRLSRGMTYKNAMAGLPFGGGKAVIVGDAKTQKTPELFKAFGRFMNQLNGAYITAEDVGISPSDMTIVNTVTDHVSGLEGKSGDPSPLTARGTYQGIRAALKYKHGKDDLNGIRVSVQGVGHVGYYLCELLHNAGAELVVSDVNQDCLDRVVAEFNATVVTVDEIFDADVDVYSPCALGASLNDDTISRLKCSVIGGAANNQLAEDRHGQMLQDRGILYCPDYVINAGGIINISFEGDYSRAAAEQKVDQIYDTLMRIFERSSQEGTPTNLIADTIAQEIINDARLKA